MTIRLTRLSHAILLGGVLLLALLVVVWITTPDLLAGMDGYQGCHEWPCRRVVP